MKKIYIGMAATAMTVGMLVAMSSAFATGAVATSCSGVVSGNTITWTATSTGGNAPYTYLWSGDASVAGATSTSFAKTYSANGTYNATVTATDASSTSAAANCSATVSSIAPATSTLNVALVVNNTAGGSAVPSNFTVTVTGAGATPGTVTGSSTAVPVVVNAATSYAVSASALANYNASMSGNCTGPIAAGATDTCTVTETYVVPTPTPTPTPTSTPVRVMPPTLSIGANGQFLSRGMVVTSVGTNSFQAQVWGVTYTVNWSGSLNPYGNEFEFWFRYGSAGTSTLSQQLKVGDEVGVAGSVSAASPLTVNATVVRDYSIATPRLYREENHGEDNGIGNGGQNHGQGNAFGVSNNENNSSGTNFEDARTRLNDLMQQLNNLQKLWKERGGHGNGNGGDN